MTDTYSTTHPLCRNVSLWPRLRCIVTCIGPNQKNQPNLDLYLVRRYKICHFPTVVSYLCIGQNQKNQPNLVPYLVRRSKIFVSVATLPTQHSSRRQTLPCFYSLPSLSFISFIRHSASAGILILEERQNSNSGAKCSFRRKS